MLIEHWLVTGRGPVPSVGELEGLRRRQEAEQEAERDERAALIALSTRKRSHG